jgi:tetratricopeptide (TPR) repeat protein
LGFAAASAVTAALVVGLGISTWMFFKEKQARQRAVIAEQKSRIEAIKSEQVATFLKQMLNGVGPSVALGRDTTMLREIVDQTADRIRTDLKDQPDVQIELQLTLAEAYFQLQDFRKMEQTARQTLALARSHLGAESLPAADALGKLGIALSSLRSLEEAETVTRQAIAMQMKLRVGDSVGAGTALCTLGNVLRLQSSRTEPPASEGKLIEAENSNRAGLAILRRRLGNDHDRVSFALYFLSMTLMAEGKEAEAEDTIRESGAIRQRVHGDEYPPWDLGFTTYVLLVRGKLDEAEACARKALELERKMGLEGKLSQVNTHFNLGQVLVAKGKLDDAETHYREAVTIARKEVDSEHRDLPGWLVGLAKVLLLNGKVIEAQALAEEALAICNRHPDSVDRWARSNAFLTLMDVLQREGKPTEAEALAREELATQKKHFGNVHRQVEAALGYLARVLQQQGRQAEAEGVWREELALERTLSGDGHPYVANSLSQLAKALLAAQKFAEAEPVANECLDIREKKLPGEWPTFNARSLLGGSLLGQKKYAEAEPLLLSGYAGMKRREDKMPATGKRDVKETLQRLVQLYEAKSQPEQAAEWKKKLAELGQSETEKQAVARKP